MIKRIFTEEQVAELSKNKNVVRCSRRSITYAKDFKISAVKAYKQGLTASEIFEKAGLDKDIIGKTAPSDCLKRWNKIFRKKGIGGLDEVRGKNGRKIKTKNLSGKDKIKWLEAEVAYLKAENDFLAKLRAKRAE